MGATTLAAALVMLPAVSAQQNATAVHISATAGVGFTGKVATFEQPTAIPPERFVATIDWGDGTAATSGTVTQVGRDGAYEVSGSHTYAAAGTYNFTVRINGPDGSATASGTATVTAPDPGPVSPSPPLPPPGAAAAILGPQQLALTDPARFIALVQPRAERHEWDLDGDGAYEHDTGASPVIDHGFPTAGGFRVGLRATLPGGSVLTAARDVEVERPPVLGLGVVGNDSPKPREQVRLRLLIAKEAATRFDLFSWRIPGVKPRRRAISLKGAPGGRKQLVRLRGAQPTGKPTLLTKFPRKGNYLVIVKALDDEGHATTLHANVKVGLKLPKKPVGSPPVDCDQPEAVKVVSWCPQVNLLSEPATKVKTVLSFNDLTAKSCLPGNITLQQAPTLGKFQQALDLPYPAPGQFGAGKATAQASSRPRARATAEVEPQCVEAKPEAVSWDFGDGSVVTAAPGGSLPAVVGHVYSAPGTYTAKLTARVPQFSLDFSAGKNAKDVIKVSHYIATRTVPVEVREGYCGPLSLNGIPLTSVPGTVGQFGIQDIGAKGCFLVTETLDGKAKLFKTFKGYDLDVNTLSVRAGSPSAADPDDPEIVDPGAARVTAAPGDTLQARFKVTVGAESKSFAVPANPLEVPKPKFDPELGGAVAALPPAPGGGEFTGLPVKSVHVFLAPDRGALGRLFLMPPKPLDGIAPVVVGGGPKAVATSHLGVPTDLEMNLSGLDLGLFELQEFTLEHRQGGGWIGGGKIAIRFLPNPRELVAPYRPLSPSTECEEISSGLELGPEGEFVFAGAAATFSPPLPVGGVAGIGCIAVNGQDDPFAMEGRVKASVPISGPFSFDGCFLMTVLASKQTLTSPGCGAKPYTAPTDVAWFRTNATLGIFGLDLTDGYLDIKATNGGIEGTVKASMGEDFGVVSFSATVDGGIVLPQFAFHLTGSAEVCEEVTKWIPGIGGLIAELGLDCFSGQAGIGTKGARFCAKSLGVEVSANGAVSFGECDVNELKVASVFAQPTLLDGPLALAAQRRERQVRLPRGLREAAFHIRGDGGPPVVTLRGPGGRRIVDDLEAVQRAHGYRLIHLARGETVVEVERPPAGIWRIEARVDGPAITGVELSQPLPEPRVSARVRGRGRERTLAYRARLSRGERVRFIEDGKLLTRALGGAHRSGRGRIRIGPSGSPGGRRVIAAVVERRGIPVKRLRVASYRAPQPSRPARPGHVRLRLVRAPRRVAWRQELAVSWRRARGARSYDLEVRVSDGRTLRFRTRRRRLRVPNAGRALRARVHLVAVSPDGRRGPPARARFRATVPRRAAVRL